MAMPMFTLSETQKLATAQFNVGLLSISQFTVAAFAVAQFAAAYSLVAQFGVYVAEGHGQLVFQLPRLFQIL
jgi:hypothetical protein